MITKEYRIPMTLGVEEYRIAQLYMIAKKSKLESEGRGNGVEILSNEPYNDGPGGSGQYTDKLYHIEARLPYWIRGMVPKSVSTIKEEAWNAYPYSKNKFCNPFWDRFSIEMESKYLVGGTKRENVFDLDNEQLSNRIVDVIDFVNDKLHSVDEENPLKYKSKRTQRGPLDKDWLLAYEPKEGVAADSENNHDISNGTSNEKEFMCVYKIVKVEANVWPVQYKVEQWIHNYIRGTLIQAHRQAWAWQDEWHGLTMDQIREMEKEVQESLANLMRKDPETN